jgi:hypothetical protein
VLTKVLAVRIPVPAPLAEVVDVDKANSRLDKPPRAQEILSTEISVRCSRAGQSLWFDGSVTLAQSGWFVFDFQSLLQLCRMEQFVSFAAEFAKRLRMAGKHRKDRSVAGEELMHQGELFAIALRSLLSGVSFRRCGIVQLVCVMHAANQRDLVHDVCHVRKVLGNSQAGLKCLDA